MTGRKGQQEGLNVAALVALLALFLIAYVVLLPPSEREKLLGDDYIDDGYDNSNNGADTKGDALITATPGIVRPFADESVKHKLSPIDLFVRNEPEVSDVVNSLYIERDMFSNRMQSVNFNIDDQDELSSVVLFFSVNDARGRLMVSLNGKEIYNSKLDEGRIGNIELPMALIAKRNTLTFSTSYTIFGSNRYQLEEVKVRKQYNVEKVEQSRTFVIDADEYDRMNRIRLSYFTSCLSSTRSSTELQIRINDRPLESLTIPCVGDESTFDIDKDLLKEGRNDLMMKITDGDFRFTDIEVIVDLDERVFPTYNFVVDDDQFTDLGDDDVDAVLKMNFLDDSKRKEAELFINGNRLVIDTTANLYTKDVSNLLEEGSNALKIIPMSQFEIPNLEIRLE